MSCVGRSRPAAGRKGQSLTGIRHTLVRSPEQISARNLCNMTALLMLRRGDIKGRQVCPGAPLGDQDRGPDWI
jgi:hypothetical protein